MLEDKYDLCYAFQPEEFDMMLARIEELLAMPDLKLKWKEKRERFLADMTDPTEFLVKLIESYPVSRQHGLHAVKPD
jgi:hypothetical protein